MATSRQCGDWERGRDCGLNLFAFLIFLLLAWLATVILFIWKAYHRVNDNAAAASTWCVILTLVSTLCCFVDVFLYLVAGDPKVVGAGGYQLYMLQFIGSIFLVCGLCIFAQMWCNVATNLWNEKLKADPDFPPIPMFMLDVIRYGYVAIAIFHVPFALLKAFAGYKDELHLNFATRDDITLAWSVWNGISSAAALTVIAGCMWYIRRSLPQVKSAEGFIWVTKVNIIQQMCFDVCLISMAVLYYAGDAYDDFGWVQGISLVLYTSLFWGMHIQVFVFFVSVGHHDEMLAIGNDVVGMSRKATEQFRLQRTRTRLLTGKTQEELGANGDEAPVTVVPTSLVQLAQENETPGAKVVEFVDNARNAIDAKGREFYRAVLGTPEPEPDGSDHAGGNSPNWKVSPLGSPTAVTQPDAGILEPESFEDNAEFGDTGQHASGDPGGRCKSCRSCRPCSTSTTPSIFGCGATARE